MSKTEQSNAWQVAVALDKGKSSHIAFKWALDNVITTGQALTLVHVNTKHSSGNQEDATANIARDVFLPFRCFCTRKNVECREVVLEDTDVTKAIVEFVTDAAINKLVIGLSSKSGFVRSFRNTDISAAIYKSLPDFCTIYIIYKGKVSSMRNAVRPAPAVFPLQTQMQGLSSVKPDPLENNHKNSMKLQSEAASAPWNLQKENESIRSPFTRGTHASTTNAYGEMTLDSDISYASTGRKSIERSYPTKFSNISDSFNRSLDRSFDSPHKSLGAYPTGNGFSSLSYESSSSPTKKDVEAEIQRLRLELKQTMDMYSTARKEALTAKQRAMELQRWKMVEEQRLEEAAPTLEGEKAKHMAATETGEASKKISESEIQKRISAEMKAVKEAEKDFDALSHTNLRYRRYTIKEIEEATNHYAEDRKIGEGGYGPVYSGYLDHTPVAIKVLRSDADQGRSQFQQEVEILCCIRHPNMVLLLGACPEYGSLVYEYMANGSLEDRLFRRGNTPPIPWQHRFRIAAEIGTGLLFLHQTKPEPLVHRDLKPANILLDRNYVSKISDVGLARLVPQSVAENVTQYRMTATAGTFCYIDPEYQQTGMLGTKSDIYSLGIILLQLVTGKPPMGLAHYMDHAIEKGTFIEMLDRSVPDWPVEEALSLARLALKCAELRRKDRPALAAVILPELNRLRDLAEENMQYSMFGNSSHTSFVHGQVSSQDVMNGPSIIHSGYGSPRSRHSGSYMPERRLSTS